MKKAYIILAHKNIEQILRLIKRLDDRCSTFFLHVDKRSPNLDLSLLPRLQENVHLVRRINTPWAGMGLVRATLNAMEAVQATGIPFDSITLLSGQDYPVKDNEQMDHFFRHSAKKILMEHFQMPNYEKWQPGGGMYRLNKYFFGLKEYQLFSSRVVNFLGNWLPFIRRKALAELIPYAGSQWWTMDMYALFYILDFVKKNPAYSNFHRFTFAPDELFFQTILLNSKDEKITNNILNDNKRFVRWKSKKISHPELLGEMDFHEILHSESFFARKLDLTEHPGLFEMIDAHCLSKENVNAC